MTVGELKKTLEGVPDDLNVQVCIETPGAYVCPDGATVDVRMAIEGMDWHMSDFLIVPKYQLKLRDDDEVRKWAKRK